MAAKPRKPSMLTRQRQLVKQQQATKAASRNQLPSAGRSSANSVKATAQRTTTAVRQRANQDMATLRALADNMKRNQAREARQIKPDPSPSTRYVGPKGANPQGQRQLPPGNRGGAIQQKGGPIVKADSTTATRSSRASQVNQVRIQDLGNAPTRTRSTSNGLGSSPNKSLPASGESGGSKAPRGTTTPQRGGPARSAAQVAAERRSAAASKAAGSARGSASSTVREATGQVAKSRAGLTATLFPIAQQARNAIMRRAGVPDNVMKLQEGLDNAINTAGASVPGDLRRMAESRKRPQKTAQPLPSTSPEEAKNYPRLGQNGARVTVPGTRQAPPAPKLPATRQAGTQSSGRPRSAAQQSTTSVPSAPRAPQAPKAPQSAPKSPDKPSMTGVGPVKEGDLYADKLKISQIDSGKQPDMERRRAFLDAKDSLSGMKAVRELLAKRKKRMGEG